MYLKVYCIRFSALQIFTAADSFLAVRRDERGRWKIKVSLERADGVRMMRERDLSLDDLS